MESKKRFAINGFAQVFAFLVSIFITFFLTPYIVSKLGAAAYGFVGLASNFVGYAQIITIALNSMAGRFITISVHQNRIEDARKYFSSVFFSNLIIVGFVSVIAIAILFYLEYIINIPDELLVDVKVLFGLIFLNFFISIVFNTYNVSTFITNRLDLSSTRSIVSNIIKSVFLVGMFYFFSPSLWYIGLATVLSTIYVIITNIHFRNKLTPELRIGFKYFDVKSIKELLSAGIWNVVSKLNTILSGGLDLLLANLFVSPIHMGVLSISRRIPSLSLTLYERINAIFAPTWTRFYAQDKMKDLHKQMLKSIRFFAVISILPMAYIFAFSDWFYQMWVPSQDAKLLYHLTIIGCTDLPVAMPLQPIYNIFPIANKIKANSLFGLGIFSLTFIVTLVAVYFTEDNTTQIMIIAGSSAIFNAIKSLTFLPIYGAHCIKINPKDLYKYTGLSVLALGILLIPLFIIKNFIAQASWLNLGICGIITCIIGVVISYVIICNKDDRIELREIIQGVFSHILGFNRRKQ